jgi:serine/threonine protein kinase
MSDNDFAVIRELCEDEEASGWTKSVLAINQEEGKKVLITRLSKDKIIRFYTYRENASKLTPAKMTALHEKAEKKYKEEEEKFISINKKVKGLSHPNIAKVIGAGIDSGTNENIVLTEFASGMTVYKITEGMPVACMAPLFLQMIDAVSFMHQNSLLHLNLKPRRIRVLEEQNGFLLKLTDFGYAVNFGEFNESYLPTPPFCAPEVALLEKDKIGETSDLYSLGAIMYYCMTRVLPFPDREQIETPNELIEVLKTEYSEPMTPSQRKPDILEMPYVGGIPYKVDSEKVLQLEKIVMGLIQRDVNARPVKKASQLFNLVKDVFSEAVENRFSSSATISTMGI